MRIWKRNAVVSTIVLFVCVALYLSWSYGRNPDENVDVLQPGTQQTDTQKTGTDDITQIDSGDAGDIVTDYSDLETESTYFDEERLNRQKSRDSAMAILAEAADRKDASQEIRDKATSEIETLAKNAMLEANVESLIKAKGYSDCVAIINQNGISVIVAAPVGGLTSSDATRIQNIVMTNTSLDATSITITEVET